MSSKMVGTVNRIACKVASLTNRVGDPVGDPVGDTVGDTVGDPVGHPFLITLLGGPV